MFPPQPCPSGTNFIKSGVGTKFIAILSSNKYSSSLMNSRHAGLSHPLLLKHLNIIQMQMKRELRYVKSSFGKTWINVQWTFHLFRGLCFWHGARLILMTQLKKNGDKIFRRNTFSIDSKSNPKLFQIFNEFNDHLLNDQAIKAWFTSTRDLLVSWHSWWGVFKEYTKGFESCLCVCFGIPSEVVLKVCTSWS